MKAIWQKLYEFCSLAGDIGPYPVDLIRLDEASYYNVSDRGDVESVTVAEATVAEARAAWKLFQGGDRHALHHTPLSFALQYLGYLAGRRLGLDATAAVLFGDWLAQVISGWYSHHGNQEAIAYFDEIAAQAVYGDQSYVSRGYLNADFWEQYKPGVKAVVQAVRYGLLGPTPPGSNAV